MRQNSGHLAINRTGKGEARFPFVGHLSTLAIDKDFALAVNDQPFSDRSPSHHVIMRGAGGQPIVVGKAWEHEIRKGERAGKTMFSLKLDSPEIPNLNLSAWPDDDDADRWYLVFDRSRDPVAMDDSGEQRRAERGAGGDDLGDEIPF